MTEEIKKLIAAAIEAPSGENCQPWRFKIVSDLELELHNDATADNSLYNQGQRGSFVAHGAAIENLVIAARHLGLEATIELFPNSNQPNFVAKIKLTKTTPKEEPLVNYLEARTTNRKPYKRLPLAREEFEALTRVGELGEGGVKLVLTEDKEKIKILAAAGSGNERVMFNNQFLHQFFFSHINWTKEEDEAKRVGFYLKTLELPPPAKLLFPIFRRWPMMSWLNRKLGFYKQIAKQNAAMYATAPVFGIITAPDTSPRSAVLVGRLFQRFWLTATKLGLALQPLTGVLFFTRGIESGETSRFSPDQLASIKHDYAAIKNTFNVGQEPVFVMFRLGHAPPPSARATRHQIEKFILPRA
ncbi:MAG: hypothetical protein AAB455_00520 [Patescibacteria group bacterium]